MYRMLVISVTVILFFATIASGKIPTRCFVCRSRAELGDCKDPFTSNATSVKDIPGQPIQVTHCLSGWCRKQIEGIRGPEDDFGEASERACLNHAPRDEQERCVEVKIRNKISLFCVCRGDLCNSAPSLWSSRIPTMGIAMSILTYVANLLLSSV